MHSTLALAFTIVLVRSAGFFFQVLNIDESDFALIGKSIAQGALPYVDTVDIKPPLTLVAFVPAGLFGGVSLLPMRILAIGWVLATALVLRAAARRWTRNELAGWCAAWLSVAAGMCELPSVSSELLMNLPAAGALYFWTGGKRKDDLLCGFLIGLAALFRQQGGILLVALVLALVVARDRPLFLRGALLALGFALPWLGTFAFYAHAGHGAELWEWVIGRNLLYAAEGAAGSALWRAAGAIPLCVGAALLPWTLAVRETLHPSANDTPRTGLVASLWLTWIAVSLGGRFYEHYFLQFVPPLSLCAAAQLAALLERWPALSRRARAALIAAAAVPAVALTGYSFLRGARGGYPSQEPRAREIAAWLSHNTAPDDRLFVWGHFSPIYLLSQRLPGTRYLTTSVHIGNFDPGQLTDGFDLSPYRSDRDVERTIADLESHRVPLVVDTTSSGLHHWDRVPLSAVPALDQYLHLHYALAANVAGARIYRRTKDR